MIGETALPRNLTLTGFAPPPAPASAELDQTLVISVVLPCLNEADAIGGVVRKALAGILDLGVRGEVIVVDNGSDDGTATEAARAGARVIHEPIRGYGNAYLRGFAEARGHYVVMADGDDTYPVHNLRPFYEQLESGADFVNGDRFGGRIEPGAMTWSHRYVGTPVLSWLLRSMTGAKLADSQCGMRAFRRDILDRLNLRAPGMEFASEMLVQAARAQLRIEQVPITLAPRVGESKLQTLPDGWRHIRYLLVANPDVLFFVPGVSLMALGLLILLLQMTLPQGVPLGSFTWQPAYASVIFGSVGAQVLWFGLLARIYCANIGILHSGRIVTWFSRLFTLERSLAISAALLGAGVALEVGLALQQLEFLAPRPLFGAAGAFFIIVGMQSCFGSFLAYLLNTSSAPNARL